jgi:hypothetical protein
MRHLADGTVLAATAALATLTRLSKQVKQTTRP